MKEYRLFDGEATITFNIVHINLKKNEVKIALTNRGRISIITYDLYVEDNDQYFEFGCDYTKIYIKDFKEISQ